jgi:glycosyltransferase involved in cell wall biosynthesis
MLRVLYVSGSGNIIGTYHFWKQGEDDPSQVAVTYSGQFFQVCRELNACAYAISPWGEEQYWGDGQFAIAHRPIPFFKASGILYHLGLLWWELRLIISALTFRANVAVVADTGMHWFMLTILSWMGIKVVPSLHCLLWKKYGSHTKTQKLLLQLNRSFFAQYAFAILVGSKDIEEQVEQLTQNQHPPNVPFLPIYRQTEFVGINEPEETRSPFRVLFAGRIEPEKGVFDLLKIAQRLADEGKGNITFDICGDGSALESLKLASKQMGIENLFVCHGHCSKPQMRGMFNQSHAVIVSTKTDFAEGFNQVVAESILSGRPVVTSSVCPALSYVRDGVVEVPPDDIEAYGDALLKLSGDRQFYEEKRRNCLLLQEQFYDMSQSWGVKLQSILEAVQKGEKVFIDRS